MDGYNTPATGNPVTLKVSMIDKEASASVSANGNVDTILRTKGITYTLTKLNNALGTVTGYELIGADKDLFNLTELEPDKKGQKRYFLTLKEDAVVATNKTYKVQIQYVVKSGEKTFNVCTPVLNIKPVQSAVKLSANPLVKTIYQSQSRSRTVSYAINMTGPAGAKIDVNRIRVGNIASFEKALVNATNINILVDGNTATVTACFKDTSKLVAGKTYTISFEIYAAGGAGNVAPAKINLSLKVLK